MSGKHLKKLGLKNAHIVVDKLSDVQKGYLSAFLDGEGGIQVTRSTRKGREYTIALHPTVYFTNTNLEAIQSLRDWLSCGTIVRRVDKIHEKDSYILHVTGTRNILALLKVVRPYLIIKKRQADLLIEYCESRLGHYRGGDRRYNTRELEIYTELKRINMKGGKKKRQPTVV